MHKIFLIFCFPLLSLAQTVTCSFERRFGTSGNEVSRSLKQVNSGSIFMLGNSTNGNIGNGDISLTKIDRYGNWQWTQYYGTSNIENGFYLNITNDGNMVFVAETQVSSNDLDILIYKVDTSGSVIWSKTYSTPVNESARYVEQTSDLGYVVAGYQNDAFGFNNSLVLKLDAMGNYQWHQSIGGNDNDYADMIHQISGNRYILTGDSRNSGSGDYDVALFELDSLGNVNWGNSYGDSLQNGCQGILLTNDNSYISFGETEVYPLSPFDFLVEKINANGQSIWRYTYGGVHTDAAFSCIQTSDGGYLFTGYSNSYNGGAPLDLAVFKIDSAGTFLWENTYGNTGIDIGYEIRKSTVCTGYVMCGYSTNLIDLTQEYYVLEVDENGVINDVNEIKKEKSFISEAYPNPTNNGISIRYSLADGDGLNALLVVYNQIGMEIKTIQLQNLQGTIRLDTEGLADGIYFFVLKTNASVSSTKKSIITKK